MNKFLAKENLILKKYFGYDEFRKGQHDIIKNILQRKDTLAIMPTGGGKSICFQIPALIFEGVTVVISPLISLMKDQVDALNENGISSVFINSSLSNSQCEIIYNALLFNKYKIIYIAPERLENSRFLSVIKNINVSQIAVDEAHCVSQWGPEFRPQYLLLKTLLADVSHDVTLMLTATATQRVQDDILIKLGLRVRQVTVVRQSVNRPNIFLSVQTSTSQTDKQTQLLQLVKTLGGAGIVYFSSRKQASQVAQWLQEQTGLNVAAYHAGMSQTTRYKIQHQFMHNQLQVICATSAFGMGIDKEDIRFVIHYHVPANLENYVQEIGRAGRDGQQSLAVILYSPGDEYIQVNLSDLTIPSDAVVNDFMSGQIKAEQLGDVGDLLDFYRSQHLQTEQIIQIFQQQRQKNRHNLDQLLQYVNTTECRRAVILNYFGEQLLTHNESCCDGFDNPLNIEQLGLKKIEKTSIKPNVQSWQSRLNQLYFVKS